MNGAASGVRRARMAARDRRVLCASRRRIATESSASAGQWSTHLPAAQRPAAGPATCTGVQDGGNGTDPARGAIETALLVGVGWASLTAEAVDELADELARRVGIERDELRRAVRDTVASWRRDAESVGLRREEALDRLIGRLRLARREQTEDLALRVAQLEHRLRLLESGK